MGEELPAPPSKDRAIYFPAPIEGDGVSGPGRVAKAGLGVAALVLIVAGTALRGPVPISDVVIPPPEEGEVEPLPQFDNPLDGLIKLLSESEQGNDWSGLDLSWVGPVATVLAVLVLVIIVFRLFRRFRKARVAPPSDISDLLDLASPEDGPRMPVLLRGVEAARASLESYENSADAVIGAWLELEEAAHDAGVDRHPAQTPTEFTVAVLMQTGADDAAIRDLLELYHLARFSSHEITDAHVRRASDCLGRIAASWPTPIEMVTS